MRYREIGKTGITASVLGMGCMRLPVVDGNSSIIDENEAIGMIRYAIDHGVNYVDTAYPYHGGNSEVVVGKALMDGYREKVTLVTKAPSWLIKTSSDFEKHLDEQLEKLQTDHLDIYLLHAIDQGRWDTYKSVDIFAAIEEMKAKGKIKYIGFSYHDGSELFKEVIAAYPWDVCMLQFNYMDINEQAGLEGFHLARKLGIPVIVMEPLKGGMLANPSEDIRAILNASGKDWSPVEWALRFVADFENVKVVLSGMSTLDQIKENLEIAERLLPQNLTESDQKTIELVRAAYITKTQIPCTDCKYCMPCPHGVEIPRVFGFYNRAHMFSSYESVKESYQAFVAPAGKAGSCIACGECEPKCPQQIKIIERLAAVKDYFGA